MKKNLKYSEIKNMLNEMLIDDVSVEEIEKALIEMIHDNPDDILKYKKAFFALIKDTHVKLAIKYAEDVLREEQDPKFMKVLAVRYKRVGKKSKYQALINTKIPLTELQQTIQTFIDNHDSFDKIESYIQSFKNQHIKLRESVDKIVFVKLKDIYTKEVLPYGEAVIAKEYDIKFVRVLATRYKRIGNQQRHDELLSMLT